MPGEISSNQYAGLKRALDVAMASVALALALPLLAAAAIAIKLDSPGPVLFCQQRVGKNNKIFTCLKLRTMVAEAPNLGSWQTADNDPRITRAGKFLRRSSLDEVPQLLNVLSGSMSLVGPRPIVPQQIKDWQPGDLALRHSLPPGITGLAQVNGRSSLSQQESDRLDLDYSRRSSLALDLHILLQTITAVMTGRGTN